MPQWFKRQLRRAFYHSDIQQIRLLNDCWFQYVRSQAKEEQSESPNQSGDQATTS